MICKAEVRRVVCPRENWYVFCYDGGSTAHTSDNGTVIVINNNDRNNNSK